MTEKVGPIDDKNWPETLTARVVTPGPNPRLHGYDVQTDLAQNYSFSEVLLTSLLGEAPTRGQGATFDRVLTFLSPASLAEAPGHAAIVAKLFGYPPASNLACGAMVLTEQAQAIVEAHQKLRDWLTAPTEALPKQYTTQDPDEDLAVASFAMSLPAPGWVHTVVSQHPTLMTALLGELHEVGVQHPMDVMTVLVVARLGTIAAEVRRQPTGAFDDYPMCLPEFRYTDEET